jgi:hypothetical protein
VLYTFLLTETLATFVGISVVGGVIWPRANRWGAVASLLSALATNFLLYYLTGQRLDHWDANVFLAALMVGIVALVAVSLLTQPEPEDRLASFFGRLQTSSDEAAEDRPLLLVNVLRLRCATAGRGWRAFRGSRWTRGRWDAGHRARVRDCAVAETTKVRPQPFDYPPKRTLFSESTAKHERPLDTDHSVFGPLSRVFYRKARLDEQRTDRINPRPKNPIQLLLKLSMIDAGAQVTDDAGFGAVVVELG